jgi:hypothetical protein
VFVTVGSLSLVRAEPISGRRERSFGTGDRDVCQVAVLGAAEVWDRRLVRNGKELSEQRRRHHRNGERSEPTRRVRCRTSAHWLYLLRVIHLGSPVKERQTLSNDGSTGCCMVCNESCACRNSRLAAIPK